MFQKSGCNYSSFGILCVETLLESVDKAVVMAVSIPLPKFCAFSLKEGTLPVAEHRLLSKWGFVGQLQGSVGRQYNGGNDVRICRHVASRHVRARTCQLTSFDKYTRDMIKRGR